MTTQTGPGAGVAVTAGAGRPCVAWRDGAYCGATPTRLFLTGPLCAADAPVVPVSDPATRLDALRAAARSGRPRRYFDGSTPARSLVPCPKCGFDCAATLGEHPGAGCMARFDPDGSVRDLEPGQLVLARLEITRVAAAAAVFSSNDTRAYMDAHHIPVAVRRRAFAELTGTVMEPLGYTASTDRRPRGTEPRQVRTYRSLIHTPTADTNPAAAAAVDRGLVERLVS